MKNYLSFDFGGTFIKYGLVREDASVLGEEKVPTPTNLETLLELIETVVKKESETSNLEGIAISCPGTITESGWINGTSAIPYLYELALKDVIEAQTGKPVSVENDANCAALAELWQGAAQGYRSVAVIVIGTGVGGAIIADGMLYRGGNLYAGEFGYGILYADPRTGNVKTWSDLGSTSSIIRKVAEEKGMDIEDLSGEQIFAWAEAGDQVCSRAIHEFYFMLAVGIHNVQHIYDPELILLGGGISVRDDFIPSLSAKVGEVQGLMDLKSMTPMLQVCHFKNQANLIGAAYHFRLLHQH